MQSERPVPVEPSLEAAFKRMKALAGREWPSAVPEEGTSRFSALVRAADELSGAGLGHGPRTPRIERARRAWEAYEAGGTAPSESDLRTLCWEPEVARTEAFCSLVSRNLPLGRRALRGFMASYHDGWTPNASHIENALERGLKTLPKSRGIVAKWRSDPKQLIGRDAPDRFAVGCAKSRVSVTARLAEWGLSASSNFARQAASRLAPDLTSPKNAERYLEFSLATFFPQDDLLLDPASWGAAFDRLVSCETFPETGDTRQRLIDLALKTRGLTDPRLRQGEWANVPERARKRVLQWLSEEDLRFFFDLLLEDQADPHRRRDFWIRYVDHAVRSRVVIGRKDEKRLFSELQEIRARGRTYAQMRGAGGANDHVSAFVMDFGDVTIVEFSQPNSACYIYANDPADPYLDLSRSEFEWGELKNRRAGNHYSHVHPPRNWHGKFEGVLASHGIRTE